MKEASRGCMTAAHTGPVLAYGRKVVELGRVGNEDAVTRVLVRHPVGKEVQ